MQGVWKWIGEEKYWGEGTFSTEREKGEIGGSRECSAGFTQDENFSAPQTGEQGVLNVVGFFASACGAQTQVLEGHNSFQSRAVVCTPGEKEGAGPGVQT